MRGAIAVWGVEGCDRFWEVEGVRSLFGELRGAIAVWELRGAIAKRDLGIAVWEVGGVRSLFGKLKGCDRFSNIIKQYYADQQLQYPKTA
ncbi:MAG: hypothetical protein PT116_16205 [Aphanizomenon gracile PMC638.10]|nr:hypothetical protein [Aphanizomenon gracile PMC638.10]